MKSITKRIKSQEFEVRAYDLTSDELVTMTAIATGEKPTIVSDSLGDNYKVLKIVNVGTQKTALYKMPENEFIEKAIKSDMYHQGFINRALGGKGIICKIYDLESDEILEEKIPVENEKQAEKYCKNNQWKLIKVIDKYQEEKIYYYMSDEMFIKYATEVIEK